MTLTQAGDSFLAVYRPGLQGTPLAEARVSALAPAAVLEAELVAVLASVLAAVLASVLGLEAALLRLPWTALKEAVVPILRALRIAVGD